MTVVQRGAALALVALLALSSEAPSEAKRVCTRTFKGREHLHPSVHQLPALNADQVLELSTFPKKLDWCEQGFCTASWNQHIPQYCGSCFAHGALSAAQDRIKIMHKKQGYLGPDVMLGRQTFLNCGPAHGLSDGCGGGEPSDVFEFMSKYGLPDETCLPYNATDHKKFTQTNGTCPPEGYCMNCMHTPESPVDPVCFPVKTVVRYRAKEYGHVKGEHAMMKELLKGPITCGIACSDGFTFNYSAGIFEDKTNFTDIDHDVEIVGWGEEDGVKYWHVRNSWGTYWGMNGFFKIVRGVNNLGIEADCHYVIPDISDEELVFSETPIYGGSHWGIVPFLADKAAKRPVPSTDDVVFSSVPLQSEELPDAEDDSDDSSDEAATTDNAVIFRLPQATRSHSAGLSIAALFVAFTSFGAAIGFVVARFSRETTYSRIN
uniref:Peptidase C1A papain C-terminal domain-containing protein n=1 Tax=Globisporangium ultimum (strain ATCC 200006 / CBS 805.95 / DAOM BR144) TaxID=431595 RepID=K3XA35_GLOUD